MIFTSRTPLMAGGATAASAATTRRPVTPPTAPTCAPRRWCSAPTPRPRSSHSGGRATLVAPRPATAQPSSSSATSSLALLDRDPALRPFEDHLAYRWRRYTEAKAAIAAAVDGGARDGKDAAANAEPPLLQFANAYRTWGLQRDASNKRVTFREWIPGASAVALIGDFNGWQPRDGLDWAKCDDFGVWTLELPDNEESGTPAIAHGSRYKLRVQSARGGWWADRVSSWCRYAVAPQGQMGATFDGVAWWPEEEKGGEAYQWQHPRPAPLPAAGGEDGAPALRIYEAHVGMSSEREEVASYSYFADEVLPRVAAQGYNAIQLMAIQVRDVSARHCVDEAKGGSACPALSFYLFPPAAPLHAHPAPHPDPQQNQTTKPPKQPTGARLLRLLRIPCDQPLCRRLSLRHARRPQALDRQGAWLRP
jgi:1,4-alpha-glucan branching enzyme